MSLFTFIFVPFFIFGWYLMLSFFVYGWLLSNSCSESSCITIDKCLIVRLTTYYTEKTYKMQYIFTWVGRSTTAPNHIICFSICLFFHFISFIWFYLSFFSYVFYYYSKVPPSSPVSFIWRSLDQFDIVIYSSNYKFPKSSPRFPLMIKDAPVLFCLCTQSHPLPLSIHPPRTQLAYFSL